MKQVEERYISLLEAEIAKFTPQEIREYEASKKAYRDIKNSIDTAKQEGKQEGLAEGMELGMEKGMNQKKSSSIRKKIRKNLSVYQKFNISLHQVSDFKP